MHTCLLQLFVCVLLPQLSVGHKISCNLEVESTTRAFSNDSALYLELLTLPRLKVTDYPSIDQIPRWISLNPTVVFEWEEFDMKETIERFCGKARSIYAHPVDNSSSAPSTSLISLVSIKLLQTSEYSSQEEEFYSLDISLDNRVVLAAHTFNGVLHGLSSLAQLLQSPSPITLPVGIRDWPDVPWRGLMIDVVRHFIPLEQLYRTIDAMEAAKFNILHLHLTDSQFFPVLFKDSENFKLSDFAKKGSFLSECSNDGTRKGNIYSLEDLAELVAFAAERGIEVIPELDVPSHALSWGNAFPDLLVKCPKFASRQEHPVNVYTLNPVHPSTLSIVQEMISQLADVFPSKYFHVGGDEVLTQCWAEDEGMRKWATDNGMSFKEILSNFERDVFEMVRRAGKVPIGWQDMVDDEVYPPPVANGGNRYDINEEEVLMDIVGDAPIKTAFDADNSAELPAAMVQSWKCWGGLAGKAAGIATNSGHDVITSACWYLDFDSDFDAYLEARPVQAAMWASRYTERGSASAFPSYHGKVLGGEAAVWTEKIDFTNFDCRVWPRAAVVATSLWGYRNTIITISGEKVSRTAEEKGLSLAHSYVRFGHYLRGFDLHPAQISLHTSDSRMGRLRYTPLLLHGSENDIQGMLQQFPIRLTDSGDYVSDGVKIVSQCSAVEESTMRPISSREGGCHDRIKIVQLNIAEGGGQRKGLLEKWLRKQTDDGVVFVGLCELNGWQVLQGEGEAHANFPKLKKLAADTGFAFSHIVHSAEHPYSVGLVSSVPFRVIGEYRPPLFQRAVLHVYMEHLAMHVLIAHFHAHNSSRREVEAEFVADLVKPLVLESKRVVVMGDLNSFSIHDKGHYDAIKLVDMLQLKNNSVYARLKKKFLTSDGASINYKPLQLLEDAGLREACTYSCLMGLRGSDSVIPAEYESCVSQNCARTQPTKYNPEWPEKKEMPMMRVDYIFVSDALSSSHEFSAGVDISDDTLRMSDHLPVYASWISH